MSLLFWRERNQHERLESSDDDINNENRVDLEEDLEVGGGGADADASTNNNGIDEDGEELQEVTSHENNAQLDTITSTSTTAVDEEEEDEEENNEDNTTTGENLNRVGNNNNNSVTLAELEEERELARRRTSACVLIAVFILFRLWIEALANSNFTLLLICLVSTSWTARWIRHNREREEELDRRISEYINNRNNSTTEGSAGELLRSDLPNLSFQAQLALAIMESQRQMMEGNFGNPDGHTNNSGISEEARGKWDRYQHTTSLPNDDLKLSNTGVATSKKIVKDSLSYGSLSQQDDNDKDDNLTTIERAEMGTLTNSIKANNDGHDYDDDDNIDGKYEELPHCSICLCEYEDGDDVVRLPCGHVYHDDCISSWTENNVRCPLCNFDLESASEHNERKGENSLVTTV